jgi:tellurite resistance protein TerC
MASLQVPVWGWAALIAALVVLLGADLLASSRRDRPVTMAEAAGWTLATVMLAVCFGAMLAITAGSTPAGQFFAGWLTEYSLSMDNLLVFVILISRSQVPSRLHGRVVLAGIGIAVVLRGTVIGLGAAALHRFGWLEYLFGLFLLYTAAQVARHPNEASQPTGTGAGHVPGEFPRSGRSAANEAGVPGATAEDAPGGTAGRIAARLTRRGTAGVLTLVVALGVADLIFAVDSIPAVFGLTRDPFLVFSANVFALLGLRHLYFLVAGLLARLVYLQAGLCVVLAFIGVKLLAEALHGSGVTSLGPVHVPQVGAWLSLAIIVLVLGVTALASVLATRRQARQRERADRAICGEQRRSRQPAPPERSAPGQPGSGRESAAQVRHDVADGDLDRLTGGARGDLDGAVCQAALAHGHPERDPGELGVAELHPGPLGPVVDDNLDARRG